MTVGNIHSSVRNAPSNNAWVLVALLPCPPSCASNNAAELREFQKVKSENLHAILKQLFEPAMKVRDSGIPLRCPDGNTRLCFPTTCAWLADYLEYTKLFNLEGKGCPACEVTTTQLGEYKEAACPTLALYDSPDVNGEEESMAHAPVRVWTEYRRHARDYKMRVAQLNSQPIGRLRTGAERKLLFSQVRKHEAWFKKRKARVLESSLWTIDEPLQSTVGTDDDANWETEDVEEGDCDTRMMYGSLWKPDLLHTMYLGMLKHVMDWIQPFLKRHGRLNKFDDAWISVPPYPGLVQPKKAYRYVAMSENTVPCTEGTGR
jgi:hypothetical protein